VAWEVLMDIDGVTALITGGASGLGAGAARALAAGGAKVALLDVNQELVEATAKELGGMGVACDVSDESSIEHAFQIVTEQLGVPRILVNSAGIGPHERMLTKGEIHSSEMYQKVIAINLTGTFLCCNLAAKAMAQLPADEEGERGVMVNIASISAYDSPGGGVAYAASKAGIVGMTLPMARDLGHYGIRVMTIAPGMFETPLFRGSFGDIADRLAGMAPFPARPGKPTEEFGALVRHIAENNFLNGEVIRIDAANRMPARFN
jgi:NAD(P)-dependent dehydrogenase (short-subunit alcohol dehydrogenase family)